MVRAKMDTEPPSNSYTSRFARPPSVATVGLGLLPQHFDLSESKSLSLPKAGERSNSYFDARRVSPKKPPHGAIGTLRSSLPIFLEHTSAAFGIISILQYGQARPCPSGEREV